MLFIFADQQRPRIISTAVHSRSPNKLWSSYSIFTERDSVTRFSTSVFFHESVSPKHLTRWHRLQMEKIFNQKNFNNFVWTPLGSRINIYIHFCLQVNFKVSAAWYCSHYLPPVSLIPLGICYRCHLPPVSLTPVANLPTVSTTQAKLGGKICRRCCWYRWQMLLTLGEHVHLDLRISP